jgi:hypothetical protein
MSTSKDKAPEKAKSDEGQSAFKDVSAAAEQAAKDAQAPVEYDEQGNVKPRSSEAANEVAQEQSKRANAHAEGGGPWPPELLAKRGIGSGRRLERAVPTYTSHEE